MALTDEQYRQVFRYADGEMDTDERKAFEATLAENNELRDEVHFYIQVARLGKSVEEKISNADTWQTSQKKSDDEEIKGMLADARRNWENQYEDTLKAEYHVTDAPASISGESNVRKINVSEWLIPASVIALISVGIFWWYYRDRNETSKASIITKTTDSTIATKITDSIENNIQKEPTSELENPSSKDLGKQIDDRKFSTLFASNFTPDALPLDKEGPLETAFIHYENRQYQEATRQFEIADIGPPTRGDPQDGRTLMAFYRHYYQALSYLASNANMPKTITELNKAITKSPDAGWKAKAQWYLALAHLKSGDIPKTISLLKEVIRTDKTNRLRENAIELNKALDRE